MNYKLKEKEQKGQRKGIPHTWNVPKEIHLSPFLFSFTLI